MKTHTNYDKSSTGTNIECTCCYDTDIAQMNFKDNFEILQHDGYRTNTLAYYIDNGNVPSHDAIEFKIKGTLEQKTAYLKEQGYTDEDMPQPEDMNDYILETYGEKITLLNYRDADKTLSPLEVIPSKEIKWVTTRGYSQGDYAEIAYCPDDLKKCWGNKPDEKQLKETFNHLFWDAPVFANVIINDIEYSYYDMPGYDEYEWKLDEFIAYVSKESGIEKETIAALLPKEPEY